MVILEGEAQEIPAELGAQVAEDYERKYEMRFEVKPLGWYVVRPRRAYAWLESSYPETATRYTF